MAPSNFDPVLSCVLQLVTQEICFSTGAETGLSQPAFTRELNGPITQILEPGEANTSFSCKCIRLNLHGAWVETSSPFLISPESPDTQPWKSSAESSTYRA